MSDGFITNTSGLTVYYTALTTVYYDVVVDYVVVVVDYDVAYLAAMYYLILLQFSLSLLVT
jgi:hypothetical protein